MARSSPARCRTHRSGATQPPANASAARRSCARDCATRTWSRSQLDEGTLVRALHRSEARDEQKAQRAPLLSALDRLRVLEDRRSAALHRLLEASSLLGRAAELGLSVQDAEAQHERHVQLALAALGTSTQS
jgi:hypothetical protein